MHWAEESVALQVCPCLPGVLARCIAMSAWSQTSWTLQERVLNSSIFIKTHGWLWARMHLAPRHPSPAPSCRHSTVTGQGKSTARPGACCTENGHSDRLPSHIRNVLISFPPLQNINRFWNLRSCHETKPSVSWPAVIAACDQPLPIEVRSYTREDPGSAHICVEKWDLSLSL